MLSSTLTILQVLVVFSIYDHVSAEDNALLDNLVETSAEVLLNVQTGILKAGVMNPEVLRAYQMQETLLANKILINNQPDLLDASPDVTAENLTRCEKDLIHTLLSITEPWAIQMIDAFAKLPSGILRGQTIWPGSYDECLQVKAPPKKPSDGFNARHAWLSFIKINNGTVTPGKLLVGACLPSSCADDQTIAQDSRFLIKFLSKLPILQKFLSGVSQLAVTFLPIDYPLDTASIACIVMCSIFVALAAIGTLVDLARRFKEGKLKNNLNDLPDESNVDSDALIRTDPINSTTESSSEILIINNHHDIKSIMGDLLVCFSVISNTESILDVNSGQGHLQCVHGIRFISMAWVILGHTYYFSITSTQNILDLLDLINTWPIQVLLQGTYSVDTFFLLSGCLMSYLFFKNKHLFTGIKPWIMFYVHRYVRLTPVYAMIMFVLATWYNSVGNGPFWSAANKDTCAKTWWWNILYINNFLDALKMCMGWSWYLANDMQFFVISPIFLIAFKRSRIAGYTIVLALLVASWITTGIISRHYNIPVIFGNNNVTALAAVQESQQDSFSMVYEKPYTRIGPYLIGVLVGIAVYNAGGKQKFLHKSVVIVGWVASQAMSLTLLYGLENADLGPITSSAHLALARTTWGITVAWVIYACITGHAGPVNTLLSWKVWIPLSRLTYCAYLVHPIVMMWYWGTLRTTLYFSTSLMVSLFLSFLVLSYGLAFIASLLFEAPILKLEKFVKNL